MKVQKIGFKHSEESKRKISECAKGKGRGGFNKKEPCPNCNQPMSAANLVHHYPQCLKYKGRIKEVKRMRRMAKSYGLTLEEYEAMLENHDNKCYICKNPPSNGRKRLSIDHCHTSNKVRKLLCDRCNMVIGMAHESPEILRLIAEYIEEHAPSD